MKKWISLFLILIALFSSLFFYNNFFHNSSFSLIGFAIDENNPPGNVKNPAGELSINPTQLIFGSTETEKTVTVSVTDPFVFKEVYICKKPCNALTDWSKIGEFDSGTRISGTNYFDARTGITKSFVIQKDIVNSGNNFVAVYTCKGVGNCNENKWLYDKFQVQFAEPIVALSCNLKTTCATGETNILELSDVADAHVSFPNSGFPQKVCCISGVSQLTLGIGDNIFFLSSQTDAHVFTSQMGNTVPLKMSFPHSKLQCAVLQQSCSNAGYDTCVLSISDVQDAHAGSCTTYNNKICCSRVDDKCYDVTCSSGVCDSSSGSCVECLSNANCASGLICSNAQCVANCGDGICGAGETCVQDSCCAGQLKNLLSDNLNCDACGNVCGASSTCNNNRYTSTGPSVDGGGLGIVNGCTRMPCIGGSCVCNDHGDPDCYDCYGNFNPACG